MKQQTLQLSIISTTLLMAIALVFTACKKNNKEEEPTPTPAPTELTGTVFTTTTANANAPVLQFERELTGFAQPQSAIYDATTDAWYVSNVNWGTIGRFGAVNPDGNGTISKISATLTQNSVRHAWVKGLNAPKGLAIANGKLYVTDFEAVAGSNPQSQMSNLQGVIVEIDLASGGIIKKHIVPFPKTEDIPFLNDIAADAEGNIYAVNAWGPEDLGNKTDLRHNRIIFKLAKDADAVTIWLQSDMLNAPSSIAIEGGTLYVGTFGEGLNPVNNTSTTPGKILKIDIATQKIEVVADQVGNLVGITKYNNDFLVSDPNKGQLLYADVSAQTVTPVINALVDIADAGISADRKTLVVPVTNQNGKTVRIYKVI